jgi:predicted N-acetyltransferase YhbS
MGALITRYIGLAIMAISPERQRQGAGFALLQSGLKLADNLHAAVSGKLKSVASLILT